MSDKLWSTELRRQTTRERQRERQARRRQRGAARREWSAHPARTLLARLTGR